MRAIAEALDAYVKAVDVMEWLKAGESLQPEVDIGRQAFDYSVSCFGPAVVNAFAFAAKDIVDYRTTHNAPQHMSRKPFQNSRRSERSTAAVQANSSYARELSSQLVSTKQRNFDSPSSDGNHKAGPAIAVTLRRHELESACSDLVKAIFQRETSTAESTIDAYKAAIIEDCILHLDRIQNQGRDPNLLTRAVRYITEAHAIPPMAKDPVWFGHVLSAIIELAVPISDLSASGVEIFSEIRVGMYRFFDAEKP